METRPLPLDKASVPWVNGPSIYDAREILLILNLNPVLVLCAFGSNAQLKSQYPLLGIRADVISGLILNGFTFSDPREIR